MVTNLDPAGTPSETPFRRDHSKTNSLNTLDAEFFQSLTDFKSDFLFSKTESILSKPPNIYRQV
jgi:hypothetical protein